MLANIESSARGMALGRRARRAALATQEKHVPSGDTQE